ncbi:MAG: PAS domain S-box protein, partial [Methanomicrobiales archaeon]|nr:PAS domain S-box protein [Methanomicrobiales archaeon]
DITKRKQAEAALLEAKTGLELRVKERTADLEHAKAAVESERQRFFGVLETMPVYVVLLSEDYHVPFANRFFRERFGESHGKRCYEYLFNRSGPCENCESYKVMKTWKPHHWEWLGPDKRNYDIYDYPFLDTDGSRLIMEVGIDVTEAKRTQDHLEAMVRERTKNLQESELRYRTVADNTYDWEFWLDPDGRFIYCSPSCEMITGHRAAEFLADPDLCWRIIHPDDRAGFEDHQREVHTRQQVGKGQWRYLRPDGSSCWVDHVCQPVYGEKGEYLGTRGSNRDITEMKKAEQALRGSEARFRALAEAMPQIVWSADSSGAFDYYNPQALAYGGVRLDEATGWSWESLIHADDLPATMAVWQQALRTGEPNVIEHRLRRSDGEYRWHLSRGMPIRDEQGTVIRWIGTSTDIHDLKFAAETFLRSSQWLGIAQRAAHAGFWYWDMPTGKLTWSAELYQLFGLSPMVTASFEGWLGIMHADDRELAMARINQSIEAKKPLENEYRIVRPDGEVRWIGAWGDTSYDEAGKPLRMSGICIDISERKQAEDALRESEERYRIIVETANEGIWITDADRGTLFVNRRMADMLGYPVDEMVGRTPSAFLAPGQEELRQKTGEKLKTGLRTQQEFRFLRKDGLDLWVISSASPVFDTEGRFQRTISMLVDITDRKKAEERIAHLASVPELNPNPVLELNHSGEVIYANTAAMKTLESLGLGDPVSFLPGDIQVMLPRLLEGDVVEEVRVGERIFLETITLNPMIRTTRIYARDITDRKLAEEAMRETSEYLENLINYANAPIIVWDPEFRVTRFNHAFERLTGRKAEEVMGRGLEVLFPADRVGSSMDHIRRVMAGERWEAVEIPILHKDGSVKTVLWNSATLYEADGMMVSSAIAQGQDITDRKHVEEALRETSQYLENLINYANAPII